MVARESVQDGDGERSVEAEVEETLRDVRDFLDDPIALLERAVELLRRQRDNVVQLVGVGMLWGLDEWGGRFAHALSSLT